MCLTAVTCLLGSANHITTTLRRKKILAAINPDKVQLAEQEFPKAGKLLFGEDLPNLAAKHSELTKSLKTGYSRFCASDLLITSVDHIVQILHF